MHKQSFFKSPETKWPPRDKSVFAWSSSHFSCSRVAFVFLFYLRFTLGKGPKTISIILPCSFISCLLAIINGDENASREITGVTEFKIG